MLPEKPLQVSTPGEFVSLYPHPPILTNPEAQWQTIALAYMRQPAHESPEVCMPLQRLAIYTTSAVTKRTLDGKSKGESIKPGDITVIPANVGHRVRWMGEEEMIQIGRTKSGSVCLCDRRCHQSKINRASAPVCHPRSCCISTRLITQNNT